MDIELEQEMYIDPQIAEISKQRKMEDSKRADDQKKARKRECAILVTWTLLFVARYLKMLILKGDINLNQYMGYETVDMIKDIVVCVIAILNLMVFIMCLDDITKIDEVAEQWQMVLVVATWIFFRPIYLVMRGMALNDEKATIRGGIWGFLYCLVLCYYMLWSFGKVIGQFGMCG